MAVRLSLTMISILLLSFAWSAQAAGDKDVDVHKLMQANGCAGCHAADTKRLGPAWSWIAWRYHGKPGQASVDEVANFIISGGTGYWAKWTGGIPMPAHPDLDKKQAEAIARWILAQTPAQPPDSGG